MVVAQYVQAFQTLAQNVISLKCTSFSGLRKMSSPSVPEAYYEDCSFTLSLVKLDYIDIH